MLGKRKRDQGPPEEETESLYTPSLTHGNLKAFDADFAAEIASITKNYPSPFNVMPYKTPSSSQKTAIDKTSLTNLDRILDLDRFFLERKKPIPPGLEDLLQDVMLPRGCDITPNSKNVKNARDRT
ncbi:MAG: hypothetical protein Q9226_002768 [Calogaya cf. arnoldii]